MVHPSNLHDRLGAKLVLGALGTAFPRLQHIWADQGYAGTLRQWTKQHLDIELEVVYPWWRQLQRYLPDLLDEMGFQPGCHVFAAALGRQTHLRLAQPFSLLGSAL